MQLQSMFKSDINRNINGVIKVAQDDEAVIEQELREYIITRELRKHFSTFLDNYEKSLDNPTDKIGVWISGFFGSGKSHFLKMLSYALANKTVAGKKAVDYFADKFEDQMMFAQLERCASVPTETILFNIDLKSSGEKDSTALIRVFAKAFYEHRGFYGDDLKIAKLEQFIEDSGKTEAFKAKFEEVHGESWEDSRDSFTFFEDDVVEVLTDVLDMSETAARNWFNGTETADISIEQLVKEIKKYIDAKGKNFRLLFMVDEVGQYIGSDSSLMLNLQTLVEEIGSKCGGRVWVMVTSQEAIDSITKIAGNDFSKIQGRFDTRLSLSSSSVDEVIKKRILAKTEDAEDLLKYSYSKNSAVLKNLFTFNGGKADMKGYAGEGEFVDTYPFVPYQFRLLQNVFVEIRTHGNSGKHLSEGERSMLSGFKEAAQAVENKDENTLVPFGLFYNTVNSFLESAIRRVIDRCQQAAENHDGIEAYDVEVLKLLYMIRYVDDIPANVENITTLMVDDINADKIAMRQNVRDSLDRLVNQNYAARNGEIYTFLTDEEQDVERNIRNTPVDSAAITKLISDIIFMTLYPAKKFKYGKNDIPFDRYIDETCIGQPTGAVCLRILTDASDLYRAGDQALRAKSDYGNEAILLLSDKYHYFEDLENAAKIRKYVMSRNVSQLPEQTQTIIRGKQQQATVYEKNAKEHISAAILDAKVYIPGDILPIKAAAAQDKIDETLKALVESVYVKLDYVTRYFESDHELLQILANKDKAEVDNPAAVDEVENYLDLQKQRMVPASMADIQRKFSGIPYGWREIDIAAAVCTLIAEQKADIHYSGSQIQPTDKRLPDYLRKRNEIDKTIVNRRVALSEEKVKKSRVFLKEYFDDMNIPTDEDGLIAYILKSFEAQKTELQNMLDYDYASGNYPGKPVVENGVKLCARLLSQQKDNTALLDRMIEMEGEFLDQSNDMIDVRDFFKHQKSIFDKASALLKSLSGETGYLRSETEVTDALAGIKSILEMPKPYSKISELTDLSQKVKQGYGRLLDLQRQEVNSDIQAAMAEIHQTARDDQKKIIADSDAELSEKRTEAAKAETLTQLDAMKIQIGKIRTKYIDKLMFVPERPDEKVVQVHRSRLGYSTKLKNEKEIDEYVAEIKQSLMEQLAGNDVLHII